MTYRLYLVFEEKDRMGGGQFRSECLYDGVTLDELGKDPQKVFKNIAHEGGVFNEADKAGIQIIPAESLNSVQGRRLREAVLVTM